MNKSVSKCITAILIGGQTVVANFRIKKLNYTLLVKTKKMTVIVRTNKKKVKKLLTAEQTCFHFFELFKQHITL